MNDMNDMQQVMTPKQIVKELDRYIVGQSRAKRAVAVALRNRYRRQLLAEELREDITPKNILMIGPTGVGKTEIARRLAKLVQAPFIKVEATKFTEVGYVGRDVESMIRDLIEVSIRMVKEEKMQGVEAHAVEMAEERIAACLVPDPASSKSFKNPLEMLFAQQSKEEEHRPESDAIKGRRKDLLGKIRRREMENQLVEIEVEESNTSVPMFQGALGGQGMDLQEMLGSFMPKKKKNRSVTVKEARKILTQEEAAKLIDMDETISVAVTRAEENGIIFLDEIDKVAGKGGHGPDVSREGVQRDILPIVEGSTVLTKYGACKTDHILFIAAGAFHIAKPSDLIPELQGRFPIRVELESLTAADFERILKEPQTALIKQYQSLLKVEGIEVEFTDEAIHSLAELASEVNQQTENIGARRLHTILERLLEDLSFEASELPAQRVVITPGYVEEKLATIAKNRDLSHYIL
ncbi:MAG: clpY [Bacilli bacterium]|nr:clpY [Bacilli bacterium]